jgi:hypothetical protein
MTRSSYRDPRSVGEKTRGYIHSLKFLEEKFGSIGYVDLGYLGLVLARPALEGLL